MELWQYQYFSVLSLVAVIVMGYKQYKAQKKFKYYEIVLGGLIQDGSTLFYILNIQAKRIQDIEEKLGMDSVDPNLYKNIREKVLSQLYNTDEDTESADKINNHS